MKDTIKAAMLLAAMAAGTIMNATADECLADQGRCVAETTVPGEAPSLLPAGRTFRLVWNDEFSGDALDMSKWSYRTNFWGKRAPWFAKSIWTRR